MTIIGKVQQRKDDSGQWSPSLPARDDAADSDLDKTDGSSEEHQHSEGPGGNDDQGTAYSPKWFP